MPALWRLLERVLNLICTVFSCSPLYSLLSFFLEGLEEWKYDGLAWNLASTKLYPAVWLVCMEVSRLPAPGSKFQHTRTSMKTGQYSAVFGRWGKLSTINWIYIIAILNQRLNSLLCARSIEDFEAKRHLWPYLSFLACQQFSHTSRALALWANMDWFCH